MGYINLLHKVCLQSTKLKCFYPNVHSMKSKEDELQALAQSLRFDITDISQTCGDETNDWSAPFDGYRLFLRDRQGRRGGGVALYVIERLEYRELTVGNGTSIESL